MEYFFATNFSREEFNVFLAAGWRRFGYFFFRPSCSPCRECRPIRVLVDRFQPTKSQRRVIRKNQSTEVVYRGLKYSDEIYEIYKEHSRDRFNQDSTKEHFMQSFYSDAVPALQTEYFRDKQLVGLGFLDLASEALSSVYFIYKSAFQHLSPGNYGVIREIELAGSLELKYYYLGYYIRNNHSMAYKNRFQPYELYNWETETWNEPGEEE